MKTEREEVDKAYSVATLMEKEYQKLLLKIRNTIMRSADNISIKNEISDLKGRLVFLKQKQRNIVKEAYLANNILQEFKLKRKEAWRVLQEIRDKYYLEFKKKELEESR